jgi:integrase
VSLSRRSDTSAPPLMEAPSLHTTIHLVLAELDRRDNLSEQTTARLTRTIGRFGRYLGHGLGVENLREVRLEHVRAFLEATASDQQASPPSVATQHFRRSAIRLLFRVGRQLGLADGDPTLDLTLPPRSSLKQRPLTDDEIALCRSAALRTLTETRQPAAWALAEATGRTSEIPHIRISDLRLEKGCVRIHGASRTDRRMGKLTSWGVGQVTRRLAALEGSSDPDPPLIYSGKGSFESAQASSCIAVSETLRRAGLAREQDIGPGSVAAWAGAKAFAEGGLIDEVARMLGVRSLDRAAAIIAWDWAPGT